jgi:hypothetical protein
MIEAAQVLSSMHLLQATLASRRVAVLPPFQPTHNISTAGFIPFSDVFDVSRLSRAINLPILEWRDVKNTHHWNRWTGTAVASPQPYQDGYYGGKLENVGCWSISMAQSPNGKPAVEGYVTKALSLDISWTPIPFDHFINESNLTNIFFVSALGFPAERDQALQKTKEWYLWKVKEMKGASDEGEGSVTEIPTPSRISSSRMEPDDQMLCFDSLADAASYTVGVILQLR